MLTLKIPPIELFDERTSEFSTIKEQTLQLEHSLVSLSKWEANWRKPFLTKNELTNEQLRDYIRCMTITQNVDPRVYEFMPAEYVAKINEYINTPQTATTVKKLESSKSNGEQVTSELIYFWMVSLQIPFDPCQKWPLSRLLMLIEVCNVKNQPSKKMSKRAQLSQQHALNAARRKKYNSTG